MSTGGWGCGKLELPYTAGGDVKPDGLCGGGLGCPQELRHKRVCYPETPLSTLFSPKLEKRTNPRGILRGWEGKAEEK